MQNKIENKFYDLLSLKLSGDISSEEFSSLKKILVEYPEYRFLYDQMTNPATTPAVSKEQTEQAYANHYIKKIHLKNFEDESTYNNPAIVPITKRKFIWRWVALAAASVLLFVSGFYFYNQSKDKKLDRHPVNESIMATQKGSKSKVILPDGSVVILNSESKISYSDFYIGKNREIFLSGEAFFNVKHDAEHPFIIHTAKADIKVLGTTFNVRNYPKEKTFETSLIKGKIEITMNDRPDEKIILHPSQKIIISGEDYNNKTESAADKKLSSVKLTTITTLQDSVIAETGWVNNEMVFSNESLEEIATNLEKQFNIKVIFKNEKVKKYRYTGVFSDSNLHEILQILQLSKKINYTLTDTELIIE